jgi:hypothetical protein
MAARGMNTIADLLPHLADRGIHLSNSQVYRLIGAKPERINLTMLAAILDTPDCTFEDLCPVTITAQTSRTRTGTTDAGTATSAIRPARARGRRNMIQCSRCGEPAQRTAATWPEGRVCRRCYQRATRIHGTCPACQHERLLPGLIDGNPACTDCAGITQDFHCSRCCREDEPARNGLCSERKTQPFEPSSWRDPHRWSPKHSTTAIK